MSLADSLMAKFGECSPELACRALVRHFYPNVLSSKQAIDVGSLIKMAGVPVLRTTDDSFEGMLSWDSQGNEQITLAYPTNQSRGRFTQAHELGHWLLRQVLPLPTSFPRFRRGGSQDSAEREEEQLANLVAAEILLPLPSVASIVAHRGITLTAVSLISRQFQVSRMAALRRIADLINVPLVYLNLIPNRFNDTKSRAVVDDAMYVIPGEGIVIDRDRARVLRQVPFEDVLKGKKVRLGFKGSRGRVIADFDVSSSTRPIPNADLLAHSVNFR